MDFRQFIESEDEHAWHRAIDADPMARIAWADWLEERGSPVAAYMRMIEKLESLPAGSADYNKLKWEIGKFAKKHADIFAKLPVMLGNQHYKHPYQHAPDEVRSASMETTGMSQVRMSFTFTSRDEEAEDETIHAGLLMQMRTFGMGVGKQAWMFRVIGKKRINQPVYMSGEHGAATIDIQDLPDYDSPLVLELAVISKNDRVYTEDFEGGQHTNVSTMIPMSADPKLGYGRFRIENVVLKDFSTNPD